MTINASQCRGARAMLEWSRDDLAKAGSVAKRTIVDFERGARSPQSSTVLAIRTAFEAAGVQFIEENGGGPGVRLSRPVPTQTDPTRPGPDQPVPRGFVRSDEPGRDGTGPDEEDARPPAKD